MRVRVRPDSRVLTVTAFGGQHYIRSEWRAVPEGCEIEASRHPYLEIEPEAPAPGEPEPEPELVVVPIELEPPVKRGKK